MKRIILILAVLAMAGRFAYSEPAAVSVGFNLPLTGELSVYGQKAKRSILLLKQRIEKQGGIHIGERLYPFNFIFADNCGVIETALTETLELATRKRIAAMIGPLASERAIPAGKICNTYETPMIAPLCTNPMTTKNRPYIFRTAFLDKFQGIAAAKLSVSEIGAQTAAVLYGEADAYSREAANAFKNAFETDAETDAKTDAKAEKRKVTAFESFGPKEKEYWVQIESIVASKADVLFLPLFSDQIPDIMRRIRRHGFEQPVIGGEGWAKPDTIRRCGDDCVNCYYIDQFNGDERSGNAREFVVSFRDEYGHRPDTASALTWDSAVMLINAIGALDPPGDDIREYRRRIRDGLAGIENFEGVSGKTTFDAQGDPQKCASAVKIIPGVKTIFHDFICP